MASLPPIIAGPILRRTTPQQLVIWLVTSEVREFSLALYRSGDQQPWIKTTLTTEHCQSLKIGKRAYVQFINWQPETPLPIEQTIEYDLYSKNTDGVEESLVDLLPHLVYPHQCRPSFEIKTTLNDILHGSCRKPHHPSGDALLRVDEVIANSLTAGQQRPTLLLMTGDQIYADDVAGPMLVAIHQVIQSLGLFSESWSGAVFNDSEALYGSELCYYQRQDLLPHTKANEALQDRLFTGTKKPIFTTDSAQNHLVTLAEVMAMYLLVWSPKLWQLIDLDNHYVPASHLDQYQQEKQVIQDFAAGLSQVQRALAHLPVYMIFDDHDVTDDWNLTRGWEEAAYSHPFSRRILGNALIGYWVCQGWGNNPAAFNDQVNTAVATCFNQPGREHQDALIDILLNWDAWHYSLATRPKVVVLDTRTHRWRSESSPSKPSGLMDWETLTSLQQELMDESAVILVSAAPIFGVKFIEAIQRVFTFFGKALMVDAENWMAHPGAANVILNIFMHPKTPQRFVILSGDVHYSFAYDVSIRFRKESPQIWQITSSGLKNEFPPRLLRLFGVLDRWLYASRSPLNWFTKRRRMRIEAREIALAKPHRLANASGVGRVILNDKGHPQAITVLPSKGEIITFCPPS